MPRSRGQKLVSKVGVKTVPASVPPIPGCKFCCCFVRYVAQINEIKSTEIVERELLDALRRDKPRKDSNVHVRRSIIDIKMSPVKEERKSREVHSKKKQATEDMGSLVGILAITDV